MNDNSKNQQKPPGWFKQLFHRKPADTIQNRGQLIDEIRTAHSNGLLVSETLGMIEGVLQVDHLQARDIMLPRSQIRFIQRDRSYREILELVLESGHSRYPVIDENRDDIDGFLHVKDLLKYIGKEKDFDIDDIIRNAVFASESQRLDKLLAEFKTSRNHMAVIIDEYGGISGLVTIEDILEQIVGEIDDEHDIDEKPMLQDRGDGSYTIMATTAIDEINQQFSLNLPDHQFDTIGGLVTHTCGKIPKQGDETTLGDYRFVVLSSDGRRIQLLHMIPSRKPAGTKQVA